MVGSFITIVTLLTIGVEFVRGFTWKGSEVCHLGHPYLDRFPGIRQTCCKYVQTVYTERWIDAEEPLMYYLEKLRSWNCPQFEEECSKQSYAITPYAETLYLRFCNVSTFRSQCQDSIQQFVPSNNFTALDPNIITDKAWLDMLQPLKGGISVVDIVDKPCLQVAMYDLLEKGRFHEVINVQLPFCSFAWCGMTSDVIGFDKISDWSCVSSR